jgi:hypothetical protein
MARMRSIKPEFWADEELADLPRDARMLYMGMWNVADEHGRLRGDPRYIKGQIFPYDDDLGAKDIDAYLDALALAHKVQRYRVDNAAYLYLPNLGKHQRLESEKVPSRLPEPPPITDPNSSAQWSGKFPDESARRPHEPVPFPDIPSTALDTEVFPQVEQESGNFPDKSVLARARLLSMEHVAGSREHVPPTVGALALRPDETSTAQSLVGEWIDRCTTRPPKRVLGQMAKEIKGLLDEGIHPDHIRRGIAEWMTKDQHPSVLPSLVNSVMNRRPRSLPTRQSTTDNRVDAALAIAAEYEAEEARQIT